MTELADDCYAVAYLLQCMAMFIPHARRLDHFLLRTSGVCAARARDYGEADLLQNLADRAIVIVDATALADDLLQIDAPPAHQAIDGPVGAGLDDDR